jgi:hypothetical protein
MSRENKDYEAVEEYYNETHSSEFVMCHKLNHILTIYLKEAGYFFEINTEGQYAKNDINFVRVLPNRIKKLIARVEFEYGKNQRGWNYEIPWEHWNALNLVTRKKYGENFDLFIKSSPTYNSIFAIDCRDGFIQNIFPTIYKDQNHNLDFETDDDMYKIMREDVFRHLYNSVNNKNICIIQFDQWFEFNQFLLDRFIRHLTDSLNT